MQRFIFLLVLSFTSVLAQAQPGKGLDLNLFKDRNQTVKNAVAPGLYLIEQDFIAVDSTGTEYGFNNQDDFGTIYSIGIKVKEGILLPSTVKTPGLLDPNFEPYRSGYTTRTSGMKARGVDSLTFVSIDLANLNSEVPRIAQAAAEQYFSVKDYKGVTDGKLVLLYADDITKLDKETLKSNIIHIEELVWDDKGIAQPKNIVIGNKTLIGGVFFYEEVTFGTVTYEPVAFFENLEGAWMLKAIDTKQSPAGGLNPIDKKKKK
jgi:hypothetical protein